MRSLRLALVVGILALLTASAALWILFERRDPIEVARFEESSAMAEESDAQLEAPSRVELAAPSSIAFKVPESKAKKVTSEKAKTSGAAVITLSELDGSPVVGASVVLGGTDRPVVVAARASAKTDEYGTARLPEVEVGVWEIWWQRGRAAGSGSNSDPEIVAMARAGELEILEGETLYRDFVVGGPRRIELRFVFVDRASLVLNLKLVRASTGEVVQRASWSGLKHVDGELQPLVFQDVEPDVYQVHFMLDTTGMAGFAESVDVITGDARLGPWKLDFDDFPMGRELRKQLDPEPKRTQFWFDNLPEMEDLEEEQDKRELESMLKLKQLLQDARRPGYRWRR